jgi:hypothetical protein
MNWTCSTHGRITHADKIVVEEPERKSTFRGPRYRPVCEENIKMDFRETEYEYVDWTQLVQDSMKGFRVRGNERIPCEQKMPW